MLLICKKELEVVKREEPFEFSLFLEFQIRQKNKDFS